MSVPAWVWVLTIAAFAAMFLVDLLVVDHKPHRIRLTEAGAWVAGYVLLAVGFGIAVGAIAGGQYGQEFFAGYVTEYALSVDNLFVFVLIMAAFRVPEAFQHKVLLVGILLALVLRGTFIAIGGAVIARFDFVFYLFGAFLVYTAVNLVRTAGAEDEYHDNRAMRLARRLLPITSNPYEGQLIVRENGRRYITPLLLAMIAIGTTDLLFALDSIPAIFGLVKQTYLVFAVNAFALMGLRQLFFLLRGLLDRLVYLGYGLAVILGFIGVKLVSETMAHDGVEWAPKISTGVSLVVIMAVLAITAVASLLKSRRDRGKIPATAGRDAQ